MDRNKETQKRENVFLKLLVYMKPWWGIIGIVVVLSLLGSVFGVMIPGYLKNIANEIQKGISGSMNTDAIKQYSAGALLLLLASLLSNFVQSQLSPVLTQRTSQKMRNDVNNKSNKIALNYFDTNPEGEILSTMTNDIEQISASFGSTLPSLFSSAATLLGCTILMFVTNPIMAVTTMVTSLIGVFLSSYVLKKNADNYRNNQNGMAHINSLINENIKGHTVIKAFGAEDEVLTEFRRLNDDLYEASWKSQYASSISMPISAFAGNIGYVAVCVVGAILVMRGHTMIGTIVAFIQYAQLFSSPVSAIMQTVGSIQPALAAGGRVFSFLDQQEMEDNGSKIVEPKEVKGEVEFDHVKFGYIPENIIVHDFSCKVRPGQKIAIVGPTGAGKSTLVNLLTRFYEVSGGDIRIDGTSIYDMKREDLHNLISMVLQETWTFEGSIRENIVYSKKNVSEEVFDEVCRKCGLTELINSFPEGADTILGENCGVSAGQKQLITIARAMIDNSPILILDEATSSVDTRTETLISTALDELMEGRTSFVIAHRLSTIQNANLILVLKDGDIIEMGSHDELMNKGGFYKDLYLSQFENA